MNKDSKKTQNTKNRNFPQLQSKASKKRRIKIGELKYIEVNDPNFLPKANKKISKRNTKNNSPSSFVQNQTECVSLRTNYNTIVNNTQYNKKNSSTNMKKIKQKLINCKLGQTTKLETINVETSNISLNRMRHDKPKSSSSINQKSLFLDNVNNKVLISKKLFSGNQPSFNNKTNQNFNNINKTNINFQNFKNNTKIRNNNAKTNKIKYNNTFSLNNKININPENSENNLSNNGKKKQNIPVTKKKINMKKYYSNNTLISPFNKNKYLLSNNHIIPFINTEPYRGNDDTKYVKVNLKDKKLNNKEQKIEELNRKDMYKKFFSIGNNQKFENCIGVTSIVINNNPYSKNSRNKSYGNNSEIKYCDVNISSKISSTVNRHNNSSGNNKLNSFIQINNIGENKILINRKIREHNPNDKCITVLQSPNAHEVRSSLQNYNDIKKIIYENYKIKEDNDYLNGQINNITKEFENMKKENLDIRKELQEKSKMMKDMKLTIDIFSRELNKLQTISENNREKYLSNRNNKTITIDIESPKEKIKIKAIKTINDKLKKKPSLNKKKHT